MQTFEAIQAQFPQHTQLVDQIKTYFGNKYWYQFGECLLTLTSYPEIQASDFPLHIFEGIFDNPNINMDKVTFAILANRAVDRIPDIEAKLNFYKKVQEMVKHPKANILLDSHKAYCLTKAGRKPEALELLRATEPEVSALFNADKILFSTFFKSKAFYHLQEGDYSNFYNYSLQYLGYIGEGEISDAEKESIAVSMAVAILVSEKIFNFSELLEQKAFQSLKNNPRYSWLYALMETFNSGDVARFEREMNQYAQQINSEEALAKSKGILADKIKIMSFAELVFTLPKNERVVSFSQISKTTGIPINLIELMIIKAMSLDLLKGSIDEVAQTVAVTWIQPRVLDKERIGTMKKKFIDWQTGLGGLLQFVENYKQSL